MKKIIKFIIVSSLLLIIIAIVLASVGIIKVKLIFKVDNEVYETVEINIFKDFDFPEEPVKAGYQFRGWYWDEEYIKSLSNEFDAGIIILNGRTLYAKWEKSSKVSTIFKNNDLTRGFKLELIH